MPTTTVRVTPQTKAVLEELSRESKQSMQQVIARAVEQYRRHLMLQRANEAYAALRSIPSQWSQEQEERRIWDATLADGFEGDE